MITLRAKLFCSFGNWLTVSCRVVGCSLEDLEFADGMTPLGAALGAGDPHVSRFNCGEPNFTHAAFAVAFLEYIRPVLSVARDLNRELLRVMSRVSFLRERIVVQHDAIDFVRQRRPRPPRRGPSLPPVLRFPPPADCPKQGPSRSARRVSSPSHAGSPGVPSKAAAPRAGSHGGRTCA